jgi:hypothetical protein
MIFAGLPEVPWPSGSDANLPGTGHEANPGISDPESLSPGVSMTGAP